MEKLDLLQLISIQQQKFRSENFFQEVLCLLMPGLMKDLTG